MAWPKNHHYVPRHLQAAFKSNDKGQIYCFDKVSGRSFLTSTRNTLSENRFYEFDYEFEGDEYIVSYENWATSVEGKYQNTLSKLRSDFDLLNLTEEEVAGLYLLVSFQYLRSKTFRTNLTQMKSHLRDQVDRVVGGIVEGSKIDLQLQDLAPSQEKYFHLRQIQDLVPEFMPMLVERDVFLMETSSDFPFILGDSPVVLHNDNDLRPYGNIGWGVTGIQIYLPLSPKFLLAMFCPTIMDATENSVQESRKTLVLAASRGLLTEKDRIKLVGEISKLNTHIHNVRSCSKIKVSEANVNFLNSLQIAEAHRFVVSSRDNFELATQMIDDDEKFKTSRILFK